MRSPHRRIAAMMTALLAGGLLLPAGARAHEGQPPAPHDLWTAWNLDPVIVLSLGTVAVLYGRGVRAIWRRAGTGRGLSRGRAVAGAAGLFALALALVSPLDRLALALFSAHMVQHLLLIQIAAPLLVLGQVETGLLWALPRSWRVRYARRVRHNRIVLGLIGLLGGIFVAWVCQSVALWLWHLPALYQAALSLEIVHALEHLSFLGAALLFWWALAHAGRRSQLGLGYAAGLLAVFTLALESSLLGALLTFSRNLWYPIYQARVAAWGLTPFDDQQLAGLIMWIPGGLVYLAATLWLMAAWFQRSEAETRRREQWEALGGSGPFNHPPSVALPPVTAANPDHPLTPGEPQYPGTG